MLLGVLFESIANRFQSTRPRADEDEIAISRRVRELLELTQPKQSETTPSTETRRGDDLGRYQ